jgi:hypothetical protein
MGKTRKRGGDKAPRPDPRVGSRKGSVAQYKSWCVTRPPNSKVIQKSEKPYSDMTPEEKEAFCPTNSGEISSTPPSRPETPPPQETPPPEMTALQKLATRKSEVPEGVLKAKPVNVEKGWIGVHKQVPAGASRKRRSRKTKRKTHRRRR